MADDKITEKIFLYFRDGLSAVEKFDFENKIKSDSKLAKDVEDYKNVLEGIKIFSTQKELKEKLNSIHNELNIKDIEFNDQEKENNSNMNNSKSLLLPILLSGIIALVISYLSIKFWGQNPSQINSNIQRSPQPILSERVDTLQTKIVTEKPIENIPTNGIIEKGSFGSSIAISRNGLFVTSYALLKDARSIHLISKWPAIIDYKAEIVSSDIDADVAILKITEPAFKDLGWIPYKIATIETGLGQDIYTIGFPSDNIKYAQGAVTAKNSEKNDTTRYELSIPAINGFYGAPIFSGNGNLIGFMSGKSVTSQSSYALKSTNFVQFADKLNTSTTGEKILFSPKNDLFGRTRPEQVDILKYFIYQVKVYY
jgi:serine protease Do